MSDEGRIIAITYSPGGRTGSWQPWVAMGSAKAALDSLVRYFAVALAPRRITVNGISPGGVFGPPNVVEGGVLRALPQDVQEAHEPGTRAGDADETARNPGRHRQRRGAPVHG